MLKHKNVKLTKFTSGLQFVNRNIVTSPQSVMVTAHKGRSVLFEYTNYRSYLKSCLIKRIAKNSNYSLRSFALYLGFTPSMLSSVLKGKKNFSPASTLKVANALCLSSNFGSTGKGKGS